MKTFPIFFLILMLALTTSGQDTIPQAKPEKQKKPIGDKLFYGGSVGVSFGNYSRIAVYPYVGIRLTKSFRVGLQPGYEYISDKRYDTKYTASNYGISLLAQYNIIPAIYIHLEPAIYSYEAYYLEGENRVWVPFVFAGAGLHQRLGGRSVLYVQVKFDLIQDANSPYKDWAPFFDVGIGIGI
jgi:hypothetical protein